MSGVVANNERGTSNAATTVMARMSAARARSTISCWARVRASRGPLACGSDWCALLMLIVSGSSVWRCRASERKVELAGENNLRRFSLHGGYVC